MRDPNPPQVAALTIVNDDPQILRILDAAANRAGEGLRVVEDYCRFVLDDGFLTRLVKELRHDLAEALTALPREDRHAMRETQADVGTDISTPAELQRTDAAAVCMASCERVKQSLRSMEEFSKVTAPEVSPRLEALRYRWYTLEKALSRTTNSIDCLDKVQLYALIDGERIESEFAGKVDQLLLAGVHAIQLRDKDLDDRQLVSRARLLRELTSPNRQVSFPWGCIETDDRGRPTGKKLPSTPPATPLVIINNRPDIAATVGADGVHLGQDDLTVKDARAIVGPHKLIGVSTHTIEQARQAVLDGADYIGVGPTFTSPTKHFELFPGIDLLREVVSEIGLPAFAIGGINLTNIQEVAKTGIRRIAVSSALEVAFPWEVAKELMAHLKT